MSQVNEFLPHLVASSMTSLRNSNPKLKVSQFNECLPHPVSSKSRLILRSIKKFIDLEKYCTKELYVVQLLGLCKSEKYTCACLLCHSGSSLPLSADVFGCQAVIFFRDIHKSLLQDMRLSPRGGSSAKCIATIWQNIATISLTIWWSAHTYVANSCFFSPPSLLRRRSSLRPLCRDLWRLPAMPQNSAASSEWQFCVAENKKKLRHIALIAVSDPTTDNGVYQKTCADTGRTEDNLYFFISFPHDHHTG